MILDPVVDVDVDELVLALRLDHVVALLAETPDDAEDREFGHLSERVARYNATSSVSLKREDLLRRMWSCMLSTVCCKL